MFLKVKEFGSNILQSWQEFQFEQDFYDMTLACDDRHIQAHKIIISSSSAVIKEILKKNSP